MSGRELRWRRAREQDAPKITDLIWRGNQECPAWSIDGARLKYSARPPSEAAVTQFCLGRNSRHNVLLVGTDSHEKVRGTFFANRHGCFFGGDYLCDKYLFVDPPYRGSGEGIKLFERLADVSHRALVPYGSKPEQFLASVGFENFDQQVLTRRLRASEVTRLKEPVETRPGRVFVQRGDTVYTVRFGTEADMPFFIDEWLREVCVRVLGMPRHREEIEQRLLRTLYKRDPHYGVLAVIERMGDMIGPGRPGDVIGAGKLVIEDSLDGSTVPYIRHPFILRDHQGEGACSALTEGLLALAAPETTDHVRFILPLNDDPKICDQRRQLEASGCWTVDHNVLGRPRR